MSSNWPHSPPHWLSEAGTYFVTASTLHRLHHFRSRDRLGLLQEALLEHASQYGWQMHAWAIFSNHYHFVASSPADAETLTTFLGQLHTSTSRIVNKLDDTPGRHVWYRFHDKRLTYEKSYMARLNYALQNPVKHGMAMVATEYPWCSASWFEQTARPDFVKAVKSFKTDRVNVYDPFEPLPPQD